MILYYDDDDEKWWCLITIMMMTISDDAEADEDMAAGKVMGNVGYMTGGERMRGW